MPAFPVLFPVGKAQLVFIISRLLMKDGLKAGGEWCYHGVTGGDQSPPTLRVAVLNT